MPEESYKVEEDDDYKIPTLLSCVGVVLIVAALFWWFTREPDEVEETAITRTSARRVRRGVAAQISVFSSITNDSMADANDKTEAAESIE